MFLDELHADPSDRRQEDDEHHESIEAQEGVQGESLVLSLSVEPSHVRDLDIVLLALQALFIGHLLLGICAHIARRTEPGGEVFERRGTEGLLVIDHATILAAVLVGLAMGIGVLRGHILYGAMSRGRAQRGCGSVHDFSDLALHLSLYYVGYREVLGGVCRWDSRRERESLRS